MPEISVIVPVYNVEKYLRRCIDSILNQTFSDFELILVDDGSTDASPAICDEYAKKDKRVVVIHQQNAGVSQARNAGLDAAKGIYIVFVDSDDYVDELYLEKLYDSPVDLHVSGYFYVDNQTNNITKERVFNTHTEDIYGEYISRFFGLRNVWGKLLKNSIIKNNNIKFPKEISYGEDTIFMIGYLNFCRNIHFSEETHYYYIQYPQNTLTSAGSIHDVIFCYAYMKKYHPNKKITYQDAFSIHAMQYLFGQLFNSRNISFRKKYQEYKKIWQSDIFKDSRYKWFKDDNWKFQIIAYFPFPFWVILYDFFSKVPLLYKTDL